MNHGWKSACVEEGVEKIHELGERIQGNDLPSGRLQDVDIISYGGKPETEHQGDVHHMLEVPKLHLQNRKG